MIISQIIVCLSYAALIILLDHLFPVCSYNLESGESKVNIGLRLLYIVLLFTAQQALIIKYPTLLALSFPGTIAFAVLIGIFKVNIGLRLLCFSLLITAQQALIIKYPTLALSLPGTIAFAVLLGLYFGYKYRNPAK